MNHQQNHVGARFFSAYPNNLPSKTRNYIDYAYTDGNSPYNGIQFQHEQPNLISAAREIEQNNATGHGSLNATIGRALGAGIRIDIDLPYESETSKHNIKRIIISWLHGRNFQGNRNFRVFINLCVRCFLRDGEIFIFKKINNNELFLYAKESTYIPINLNNKEKNIINGIQHDKLGNPKFYFLRKNNKLYKIPSTNVIHLRNLLTFEQVRGITSLHASISKLMDIEDFIKTELYSARVAALFALAINKHPDTEESLNPVKQGNLQKIRERIVKHGGIMFDNLKPGETVDVMSPNGRPNLLAAEFSDHMLRQISRSMGVPASHITGRPTASYSAERMDNINSNQTLKNYIYQIEEAISIILTWFFDHALLHRQIQLEKPELHYHYHKPNHLYIKAKSVKMEQIDPLKEAKEQETKLKNNLAKPDDFVSDF